MWSYDATHNFQIILFETPRRVHVVLVGRSIYASMVQSKKYGGLV